MDNNNFKERIKSSIFIGLIFLVSIFWLRSLYYFLMTCLFFVMLVEWMNVSFNYKKFAIFGITLITFAIFSLITIGYQITNPYELSSYFLATWFTDIFAMFGGIKIGGRKLAPKISPNKTVSGFISGVIGSIFACFALYLLTLNDNSKAFLNDPFATFSFSLFVGFASQVGDLCMSYCKRRLQIKDFSQLIPGHGGALDRFDSFIISAPVFAYYICL